MQEFRGPNSELFSVPFDFVQDLQKHPPLVSVACEVTIIHGSDDQVIPLSWIQLVKKQSPQWRLRIVEDDHALMKPHTLQTIEKEIVSCFGFHETKNR